MRKLLITLAALVAVSVCGCTENQLVKQYGGTSEIELEEGMKLEEVTWKDNNLWILVRPMADGEDAETYSFYEKSDYGIIEGKYVIIEKEKNNE